MDSLTLAKRQGVSPIAGSRGHPGYSDLHVRDHENMDGVDEAIIEYYNQGREQDRLNTIGRLEFLRTQELLERHLPSPPASIVDIGGGAGIHALPLQAIGHYVTLIDPVELHVQRAKEAGVVDARIGDARHLQLGDGVVDVALLLGPLYHLTEQSERIRALTEARRVTRSGGLLFAACISRFASTYDGLVLHYLDDPDFERIVGDDLALGQHRNPDRRSGWFTTAYLHHPEEVAQEVVAGGWSDVSVVAVEGPGAFADTQFWLENFERQKVLLRAIRRVESEASILGASPHLLAIAQNH